MSVSGNFLARDVVPKLKKKKIQLIILRHKRSAFDPDPTREKKERFLEIKQGHGSAEGKRDSSSSLFPLDVSSIHWQTKARNPL